MTTHDFKGDKGLCITFITNGFTELKGIYFQKNEDELKGVSHGGYKSFQRFFVNKGTRISKKKSAKRTAEEQDIIIYIYDYPINGTLYELHIELKTLDNENIDYYDHRKNKTFKANVIIQNWYLVESKPNK